ncbi:MAG: hypothetical protein GQ558_08180, partial [Thermoplasmata archaeon]|nr:hypothetical protein [Thermoplasmata archaeon]
MLTEEQKLWLDGQQLEEDALEGNLNQPTTPEKRSQAITLARDQGLPVPMVERNFEELDTAQKRWLDDVELEPPEVTREALHNPDLGPAVKDDIDNLGFHERFLMDTIQRVRNGIGVVKMGEIGTAMMNGTESPAQLAELEEVRQSLDSPFMQRDYGFDNPVADVAMFLSGAVAENVPIMGYMLWEAKEEMVEGAIAGTLMGAAASTVTAGVAAPVTATTGAIVGAGVGIKVGSSKAAFTLEAGNAYLEYIAMRDKNTGELMDPNIAKGAAMVVGLANAALELVAFERALRTIPGMDKVVQGFSRGGMRKLMNNSTARSALARFGANVASVSAVEGITEMAQETLTILGGIVSAELAPGEYDTATLAEAMKQIGHSGLQGMAGGGGIAVPGSGAGAYMDYRKERAAASNLEKLQELERMAKESLVAERLPGDFKAHLLKVRDTHGEATQTLVGLSRLQTFFQEVGLTDEQIAQRMPETWASMEEAELTGVEVNIPYHELGAELARMDTFDALASDIRITADGVTAREAEQMVSEREAVYEEYATLAGREEAHEGASQRVFEDVRTMLEEAQVAPSVAEPQAQLHAEFWERAGPRLGMDPFEAYKAYSGLSVGRLKSEMLEGQGFERSDAIIGRLREGAYPTQQQMFGASLTEFLRSNGGLRDEGGELAARDATSLMRNGPNAMSFEEAHQRAIEAGFMSEESWTDKSQGDLLELIDKDLHDGGIYRLGGGDGKFQDVWQEMSELEELLAQMDVDIETMTNDQVRGAIRDASLFQGLADTETDYSKLNKKTKAIVDEALEDTPEPDRVREALIRNKNTAWAQQAIAGAKARVAVKRLMEGKEPNFKSVLDHPRVAKTRKAIKSAGWEGVQRLLSARSMIGHAGKPVNAVPASFLNCEPSRNCAKYCYATGGNYQYAANIIKGELITMWVQHNPIAAADMILHDYNPMGEDLKKKALRFFDKGDGSMEWIPVIKELNKRDIRVHIFSKRPEFLRAVPEGNIRLLSVDLSNLEMAEENPDLGVALVYEGTDEEITWMNAHRDQIDVILPIMGGKGAAAAAEKAAAVAKI